ncbi:MAG: tRNA(Ile)-lysidine synthetase [Microthrixaceae bacterium]
MKCTVCRGPASIDLPRHNANFCAEHLVEFCREQVRRAIDEFEMLDAGARVLVAVSGGKDSLALWDILDHLGYDVTGLYVGLGIGDYSDVSGDYARRFALDRRAELVEVDLRREHGYDIPGAAERTRRTPCSACGLSKRHVFDQQALAGGYDAVATGHNLDDEAAVLFGNVLRWQLDYLARQRPVLPARDGLPRKVKPLVRLTERETAAYCIVSGIDYQVEECPMSAGNKHIGYKEALNEIEVRSPGSKADFYLSFQRRAIELFDAVGERGREALGTCTRCGTPSPGEICAFCRLEATAAEAVPVEPPVTSRQPGRVG